MTAHFGHVQRTFGHAMNLQEKPPVLFSSTDVSRLCEVTPETVGHWVADGILKIVGLSVWGQLQFDARDIVRLREQNCASAP